MRTPLRLLFSSIVFLLVACDQDSFDPLPNARNFQLGFTTWSYGPTLEAVNTTYNFIDSQAEIYTEHIDNTIPWNAWINDLPLPAEFTNEIQGRVQRRQQKPLLLSIGLFNNNRDELARDVDGSLPSYTALNESQIEDAYYNHVQYLIDSFNPTYLVISIEANEFRLRVPDKWTEYTQLMQAVRTRVKAANPGLQISESVSLHNLYQSEAPDATEYMAEMVQYMNQMDFVAISYYPFLKNQHTEAEYRATFAYLHSQITKPIAFSETAQIAEDLVVPGLGVNMTGTEAGQNTYLQVLIEEATEQNYYFVIWWAHRDYDALWETFPAEVRDIGQLWRDTGLLDEDGNPRPAYQTWTQTLSN